MTRVSDSSGRHALNFAISKAKKKLEDLQLKGSTLKNMVRPSDDPIGNMNYLNINSRLEVKDQYKKNINFALTQLDVTENALVELTNAMVKAKEIAIAQASDLYNDDVRKNISQEVIQLRNLALAVGNKRVGNRFIFAGYNTLTRPFNEDGSYQGDVGKISLEISKDFFIPTNLNGVEVFYTDQALKDRQAAPLAPFPEMKIQDDPYEIKQNKERSLGGRSLASVEDTEKLSNPDDITKENHEKLQNRTNIFNLLDTLSVSLENGDSETIRNMLTKFDEVIDRLVTMRTKIGARYSSVMMASQHIEDQQLVEQAQKSKIADADVAELYSDLSRQEAVLKATYKSGNTLLNQSLLDFLK
jgi:flagellar hook-associated protein 3 FlgL